MSSITSWMHLDGEACESGPADYREGATVYDALCAKHGRLVSAVRRPVGRPASRQPGGITAPATQQDQSAEAHVIVRYDPDLDAEWRLTYDHDDEYRAVLVVTFGDKIPADVALQQIRAMAYGVPYYDPESVQS